MLLLRVRAYVPILRARRAPKARVVRTAPYQPSIVRATTIRPFESLALPGIRRLQTNPRQRGA